MWAALAEHHRIAKNGGRQWHGAETRQDRILTEQWLLAIIAMPV
jgi:hypothetical protein